MLQDRPHGTGSDGVAESAQFAVDATISPGRVLTCQPQHQHAEFGCQGRTAASVRIGPSASDQAAMPAQQRRRLDEQPEPGRSGQQPREPGQHRSVCPAEPWPGHLASQHRDFVAQHEQLGVLGGRTPRQQGKPSQHLAEQQVEQSQGHAPIIAVE